METARMQLIKNNIIAKLGLTFFHNEQLEDQAHRVVEINQTTTLETANCLYEKTGIDAPCMDGMRY